MRINDYITLSKKMIERSRKSSKKNVIILTLIIIFCLVTVFVSESINKTIQSYQLKISFRTILVSNNYFENESILAKKLKNIENIQEVYTDKQFRTGVEVIDNVNNNTDHSLYLEAGENNISPEIIKGKKLSNKQEKEMICSNKIIFDSNIETNFKLASSDYINGYDLLNDKLVIKYKSFDYSQSIPVVKKTYEEEYTIVGLFDSEIYGNNNTCYTNSKNIININQIIFEGDETLNYSYPSLVAIVNNQNNVERVIEELHNLGYSTTVMERFNPLISYLEKLCNIVTIILLICCFVIIGAIIKKEQEENKKNQQILFYLGFNENNIFCINSLKNIISITKVFLIAMISLFFIYIIMFSLIKYKYIVLNVLKIIYPITQFLIIYTSILIFIIINNTIYLLERKIKNV